MGQMTLITGGERRRRWSEEDRARILAAVAEPGAVIADVARRADICSSQIYKWRREARGVNCGVGFAEVKIADGDVTPAPQQSVPGASVIIIELKAARLQISANASPTLVMAALKGLRS